MVAIKLDNYYCPMGDRKINIIKQGQTPGLFHNDCLWTKRNNPELNVAKGAYGSAETYNIVGNIIIVVIRLMFDINDTGLYRDDGVILFRKLS